MRVCVRVVPVFAALFALIGCSGPSAKVKGRVTCEGKPVVGSILFSPKGENPNNTGPAVNGETDEDGNYELTLSTIGKHNVVVSPRDVKFRLKKGDVPHPCDLAPRELDLKAGENEIAIELKKRKK